MLKKMIFLCLLALGIAGCGAEKNCAKKISLLEAEISDLRREHRELSRKMEELQIQLSVLARRNSPALKERPVSSPSQVSAPVEADEGLDENQISELLDVALQKARQGRFPESLKSLNEFIERFDDHPLVVKARLERGKLAFSNGEEAQALMDFNAVINDFPDHPLCVQALLLAGTASEKLGDLAGAKNYYLQLVHAFPLSAEAAQANKRLEAIR